MKLAVNRVPDALPVRVDEGEDPFAAFTSENAPPPAPPLAADTAWKVPNVRLPTLGLPRVSRSAMRILIVSLSLVVLGVGGFKGIGEVRTGWLAGPSTGVLTVSSNPPGAEVFIDDVARGTTPLTINVPVGQHDLTLRHTGVTKHMSFRARRNVEVAQDVELARPTATTGGLSVSSDPPGLKIAVDGAARGVTPALFDNLVPGNHVVTLTGAGGSVEHTVLVAAGGTASLRVSKPPDRSGEKVGFLTFRSPIDVQLFEGETLIGSSRSARLLLTAGAHSITAVNEALGFRRVLTVSVTDGAKETLVLQVPNGNLSVNAQPWAEVFVDGKSLGETPIGNYSLPIGAHELVFRHPQYGERRQNIVIAVGRTARVSTNFRK